MREYYNTCVTCPECLKPYNSDKLETAPPLTRQDNGNYYCPKCHAEFAESVELREYSTKNTPFVNMESGKIPIYRHVLLNTIEREYVNWICEDPKGIHLITWPWKDVRFLPIALTEYIEQHPDKKILVLGNYGNSFNMEVNDPIEIISRTFFIETDDDPINTDWIKINKNDLESNIYHKIDVIHVKRKKYGLNNRPIECTCKKSLIKCKNAMIKYLEDGYGKESIRSVTQARKNSDKKSLYHENGIWDLTFTERTEWSGKKFSYKVSWMKEILAHSDSVRYCKDILKTAVYTGQDAGMDNQNANLYILSPDEETSMKPGVIFDTIRNLNPDLTIITNPDTYIADKRYFGPASRNMLDFLKSTSSSVLLFSTEPEYRQYYQLDQETNVFSSLPVIIQTLDSDHVLKEFRKKTSESPELPSPISSGQIPASKQDKVQIRYISYLPEFYQAFSELLNDKSDIFIAGFGFFIRNLLASPLNIKDERRSLSFVARKSFQDQGSGYDWINDTLAERISDGKIPESVGILFKELIEKYYFPDKNPLRDLFIETAEQILKLEPESNVIFVVSPFEKNSFQKIIDENKMVQSWNLKVSSWSRLSEELSKNDKDTHTYVISSRYPSMSYKLGGSPIKEFIFINDPYGIQHIKEILDRRLLEHIVRPVIHPSENQQIPPCLRDILDKIPLEDAEKSEVILEEYYRDEDITAFTSDRYVPNTLRPASGDDSEEAVTFGTIIPEGTTIILCVDGNGRGLFIPMDTNVLILKENLFDDIRVDNSLTQSKLAETLSNKDIVIGKTNLYSSFRGIFFRYMMEHQNDITFERGPYSWKNYKAMYFYSTAWIRYILKAIEFIHKSGNLSQDEAQEYVLQLLASAGLTAKDPNTIRLWLHHIDRVRIDQVCYHLYRTEHPFRMSDVNRIHEILKKYVPDAEKYDLEESYNAALHIQDMRVKVLKGGKSLEDKAINKIYDGLKKERAAILSNADIFHPIMVRREILHKPVNAMKITNNYQEYL